MKDDTHGGCFPQGLQAALSEASKAGKPLLTMESLNKLAENSEANKGLAEQMIQDIPGFFRQRFYLTPPQSAFIESAAKDDAKEIIALAKSVAQHGGIAKFQESFREAPVHKLEKGTPGIAQPDTTTTTTKKVDIGVEGGATGVKGHVVITKTQTVSTN
jgi:hypothetical protein